MNRRISGSASLEAAIDWILDLMKSDGLENVRGEPVMVPRWVRGAGFTVYMPSLFGRDGAVPQAAEGVAVLRRACISASSSGV